MVRDDNDFEEETIAERSEQESIAWIMAFTVMEVML